MNKERIKSIILILLIIVNLMLAENILVDKKLWPSGYNFFNMGNVSRKSSFSLTKQLAVPEKIIINTGYQSSRFEFLRTSQEFSEIYASVSDVLKKAFMQPQKNVLSVMPDNWYSALTAKSIYLSYPCSFSAQNFASLSGISSCELGFSGFSDIVISENGQVYINDSVAGSFFRIDVSSAEISPIIQRAAEEHIDDQSVINYSFEMNFDKDFGDQRTFLSPMIPIYSDPIPSAVFMSSNPVIKDSGINQKVIGGILTAFSINPNTVWRYTEADGSLVFVENNGILKISPDGILTFTASDNGIKLLEASDETSSAVSKIAEFVDTVNTKAGTGTDMLLTSSLTTDTVQSITFDYTADGLPIKFNAANAVSATIRNGYLTEYSQILRKYTPAGYLAHSPLYIEALDKVIARYQDSMSQISIIKMYPAYIDDLSIGEKTPDWFIDIDNILAQ